MPTLWLLVLSCLPIGSDDAARGEFFEARIRPIFATHCAGCHGPTKQKGGLRLDRKADALAGGETGRAIVPGKVDQGELLKAVHYEPDGFRMPPKGKLPAEQIADLERWVREGAYWPDAAEKSSALASASLEARRNHWCWQPVRSSPPPNVRDRVWPEGDVDRFLLARMEGAGLRPTADAERSVLLRRLHAVLTGLPPTPEEIEAFAEDKKPDAVERAVDRLLASPAFGERWGRHWLDLVRYSETLGHEFDFDIPNTWRYRDYVIRAFNADLPFDQFVREHVAGDLLPMPRLDARRQTNESLVATGFWWFGEAKQAPVDVRAEQADHVDNQIDVLGKAFLGLTVACARCHDHKFDAISARDYYSLYGFCKSTRYTQATTVPTKKWREEIAARARLEQEIRSLVAADWKQQVRGWSETAAATGLPAAPARPTPYAQAAPGVRILGGPRHGFLGWRRNGPAALLGDTQVGDPVLGDTIEAPIARLHEAPSFDSARWSRRFQGTLRSPTFVVDRPKLMVLAAGEGARFNVIVENFAVVREPIYGGLKGRLTDGKPKWQTMDVSRWIGRDAYVEFLDQETGDLGDPDRNNYPGDAWFAVEQVALTDKAEPPPPMPAVALTRRRSAAGDFDPSEAGKTAPSLRATTVDAIERWRTGSLAREDALLLNALIERRLLRGPNGKPGERVAALVAERKRLDRAMPDYAAAPAAEDGDGRDEAVFVRGNSKKLGTPAPRRFLEALDGDAPARVGTGSGRLWLAKRLTDRSNPLVVRVIVNRVWRHVFGRGLVESPDNFGALGEAPTHPELLDHLADQFMHDGWSIKRLVRRLALSHAFRLSSSAPAEFVRVDPQNKWFARANLRRLDAEALRDAMLAASGSLQRRMYGPSIPVNLDEFAAGRGRPGSGPVDGGGRRTIYLGVRRNFPSSFLAAFDEPSPAGPVGKRTVSNVPAQALILLNDPFVLGQARTAANELARCGEADARIRRIFEETFGRAATAAEVKAARKFLEQQRALRGKQAREIDAWADLCHAMFNAKEFLFLQ